MDTSKPEWFLAPRDIAPNTTITLGKTTVNPFTLEGPPYLALALPVPLDGQTEFKYPWTQEVKRERCGMIGLFASFMANVGVGSELSTSIKVHGKSRIEVARLQTLKLEPTDGYLRQTLYLPRNLQFLRENRYKKSVYIVTGVKTAYGGRVTRSKSKTVGGEGDVGINPAVPGLQLGPKSRFEPNDGRDRRN